MEKIVLPNGVRVLMEWQAHARTACFGVWAKSGSAYESKQVNGISHLIEHMVFKGTERRSALDIAEEMDAIGGQMNAYTASDYTCFYARTLSEHVEQAFDILADMVTAPRFDPRDLELEKGVVLEEIGMSRDTPEERVAENLYSSVWRDSSAGLPILGTEESLKPMDAPLLHRYRAEKYAPDRLVAAICGRFDREAFLRQAERFFAGIPAGNGQQEDCSIVYHKSCAIERCDQEQTHLCLCVPGVSTSDPRRHALSMLNIIAGGSSSSRLFQRIREELGLAYSIYTNTASFQGGGLFEIQTAVSPGADEQACAEILKVLQTLRNGGVTQKEFTRAKEQLKSSLVMGMENASSRVGHMGRNELLRNRVKTEDELLEEINAVTIEGVCAAAQELLALEQLSISVVGPRVRGEFYQGVVG